MRGRMSGKEWVASPLMEDERKDGTKDWGTHLLSWRVDRGQGLGREEGRHTIMGFILKVCIKHEFVELFYLKNPQSKRKLEVRKKQKMRQYV